MNFADSEIQPNNVCSTSWDASWLLHDSPVWIVQESNEAMEWEVYWLQLPSTVVSESAVPQVFGR